MELLQKYQFIIRKLKSDLSQKNLAFTKLAEKHDALTKENSTLKKENASLKKELNLVKTASPKKEVAVEETKPSRTKKTSRSTTTRSKRTK